MWRAQFARIPFTWPIPTTATTVTGSNLAAIKKLIMLNATNPQTLALFAGKQLLNGASLKQLMQHVGHISVKIVYFLIIFKLTGLVHRQECVTLAGTRRPFPAAILPGCPCSCSVQRPLALKNYYFFTNYFFNLFDLNFYVFKNFLSKF